MTAAVFAGDSLTDLTYLTDQVYRSGIYPDMVCGAQGWTRVGQPPGPFPGDPNRAAISNTMLCTSPTFPGRADALVASWDRRVKAYNPEKLVINLGTNDFAWMSHDLSLSQWAATWETVWGYIQQLPGLSSPPIILGLMGTVGRGIPLPSWAAYNPGGTEFLRAEMNRITRTACLNRNSVFVPLDRVGMDHIRPDGHLNGRGHALVAGEILAALGVN